MLGGARYLTRAVTSPTGAWDILCSGAAVDLLLCKVMESLEDGLIERVVERFPDIPVVVWGCTPTAVFLEALRKGADNYLPVPFEREQLLVIVRRALEYHRSRDRSPWRRWDHQAFRRRSQISGRTNRVVE